MVYEERIFIIGGTGNTGTPLVRKLLSNPKIALTLYTRTPAKIQELYGEQAEDRVKAVQGDYSDLKPYEDSIKGHTRLFIAVQSHDFKEKARIVRKFAEKGYDAGVQQVVFLSSLGSSMPWRSTLLTAGDRLVEESIISTPNRKALVTLRPAYFMSNQLRDDVRTVKSVDKIVDIRDTDFSKPWVSPSDIGEIAANVLQDPVEKHGDAVYELTGDSITPVEHAETLSRVLGRSIKYEKITDQQYYDILTKQAGMTHSFAYLFLQMSATYNQRATPGLSILLGRLPETLEQWIERNKSAFL